MRNRQSGIALFVALMLLLILSMIGLVIGRTQTVEERMARNENDNQIATQSAEAALRNAEAILGNAPPVGVFAADTAGYYAMSPTTGSPISAVNWNNPAQVVAYSGPALSTLPPAAQTPRIALELMGYGAVPGDDLSNPPPTYRVTVQALNADGNPSRKLQTVYR
jgi:type IV pilus assembly protein PilX